MRKFLMAGAALAAGLLIGNSASATVLLYSTFETPDVATGNYGIFNSTDGWTTLTGAGIEIQDHVAGDPAINGGDQFVELDSDNNSSMFYQFAYTGRVTLDFLYSPRPNVPADSNGITVFLDATDISGVLTLAGGSGTFWVDGGGSFNVVAGQKLIFSAVGTDDSLGGYLDNIKITAVPEPTTWALMIGGFGAAGAMLRRRRALAA